MDLKLTYQLWKSDDTSIPISEWPFPANFHANDEVASNELFRPTRFVHIDNSELKKCWPDCVILLSLFPNQKDLESIEKKPTPFYNIYHNFKIMASNNLVEIPEKTKLDLVLNRGEEKFLLVDLKYFLSKESLVFFTYITMGSVSFKANLYTEKNPHCPSTEESASDFLLRGIETELYMEEIRKKLDEN